MGFGAVLDANVLYPFSLRDILLRLAERELFDVYWSERILDEMVRNLVADGRGSQEQIENLAAQMRAIFPSAIVDGDVVADLEPAMRNDPKDRHVLAAAVASGAQVVVTQDLGDFPDDACAVHGIEAQHPDQFLTHLFHLLPEVVVEEIHRQARELRKPPHTASELVDLLADVAPTFAQLLRERIPQDPSG